MDNMKTLKLNLTMSPRAIDELKSYVNMSGVSKYELPLVLFPENKCFDVCAAVDNNQLVWIGFSIDNTKISLIGKLEHNNFFCTSVKEGFPSDSRSFHLFFMQEKSEDFTYVSEDVKQRFSVWYDYIESLQKKAMENYYYCFFDSAEKRNEKLYLSVSGLKDSLEIKKLSIGFCDENNRPLYSIGKVEGFEKNILTVTPFGDVAKTLRELAFGKKLVIYDGASDITCKRMKSGLDKLCNGEAFNKRLPEFLFDSLKANVERGDNVNLTADDLLTKTMNSEQISAVEGVLNAKDLYLIQGPPGTGKTTVIAEICYQNAIRGLKTLIVSQSNLAVDNAISRVMNHADIRVLRKGDASRVEEEGLPFVEDNVVSTWITQISESTKKMDSDLTERISKLKMERNNLPQLLEIAENVSESAERKKYHESQLYFYKNVLEDAKRQRSEFFELITEAYENDDILKAYAAREKYPPDFILPNNIYNDITAKFMDISADLEMVHGYESDAEFFNKYTEMFYNQFEYIKRNVSRRIIDRTAYEGIFYYADREMTTSLYEEGERILKSEPKGIRRLIFGLKWGQVAAIYLRRAENLLMSIQQKSIRICDRIYGIRNNSEFIYNIDSFHICLDALGEDYDSQYYSFKAKGEKVYKECSDVVKEYGYSVECFKERISEGFFAKALKGFEEKDINPEKVEYSVNRYYNSKLERFVKWKSLLDHWRRKISEGNARDYAELKKLYIDNANVIGITCIQSGTKDFSENYPSFDVVIIDEASKSTPPDIILPMLKGKKIVLVGDHKQLPPFIDSNAYDEIESENEQLKNLIKVSLFEELYEKSQKNMRTMLFRQYRMHKDIAALINQFYIDTDAGRLESPASEFKKHGCEGFAINEQTHVLWYDVPFGGKYAESSKGKSFFNKYEAQQIVNLLGILERNLSNNNLSRSVGVITFYDAQVKLLEEIIFEKGLYKKFSHLTVRIGSVDRFQGMEEDIILLSFVRNNSGHAIGFARDERRINVALSRAKSLLMIVGCSENFVNSGYEPARIMFENIKNITQRLDGFKSSKDIPYVDFDLMQDVSENKIQGFADIRVSDEDEYDHQSYDNINILDYFILKAAYSFKNEVLTINHISNILGIAPVFVKNRVKELYLSGKILYNNRKIQITESGIQAIIDKK